MKLILKISSIFLLALVTTCTSTDQLASTEVSERLLIFPAGYYDHIVFINGKLIAFAFISSARPGERVSFAYEGETTLNPFNPEGKQSCVRYSYFSVVGVLPDGRLGLLKQCNDNSGPTAYHSTYRSIYGFDWKTQELEQLVAGRLTPSTNPKNYTWNPDMTQGIQETNSGWQGTVYWITPEGMLPMDIQIQSRGLTWNLKDHLEGKEHTGLVGSPAWSPDGGNIAFVVTTYGIRELALPKYDVSYDLFIMDPISRVPTLELSDIVDADKLVWSPNSQNLLFRGCTSRKLICGLWQYNLSDKSLSLINEGSFSDYIWITNQTIVAVKNISETFEENQIWEYIISE